MNILLQSFATTRNKALVGIFSSFVFLPTLIYAGVFSFIGGYSFANPLETKAHAKTTQTVVNLQNATFLEVKLDEQRAFANSFGGPRITFDRDGSLIPDFSPYSIDYEIAEVTTTSGQIIIYRVETGDTISEIAERYGISTNTIRWANGIRRGDNIRVGQELILLPITGIQVEVREGDTLSTVATRYAGDVEEIANYNNLDIDTKLSIGQKIIIPDGELGAQETKTTQQSSSNTQTTRQQRTVTSTQQQTNSPSSTVVAKRKELESFFVRPVEGIVTQRHHGPYGAFDIANKVGTPIVAMADGIVIISKDSGWNGGYGQYIVIKHTNNTQTLYAHLSKNDVTVGQRVTQGQKIGELGNTGRSTGPHLHFEVRGDPDPVPTPILY